MSAITLIPQTMQEAFDMVVRHLHTMPGPARVNGFGSCRYRTKDGNRCAIGALIPDDQYDPWLEGRSVRALELTNEAFQPYSEGRWLLVKLQDTHDSTVNWNGERFVGDGKLHLIARQHGLVMPVN